MDVTICHIGGSNGSLAGMIMGENSGKIEPNTASGLLGSSTVDIMITKARMTGITFLTSENPQVNSQEGRCHSRILIKSPNEEFG